MLCAPLSLSLFIAAAAAQAPPPEEQELESLAPDALEREVPEAALRLEGLVGGVAGAAVPSGELGVAFSPRLAAGVALPFWGGRLRLLAVSAWVRSDAEGALEHDGQTVSYQVEQRWLEAGGLVELRALHRREKISPVIAAGPTAVWMQTRLTGGGEGLDVSAAEAWSGPGLRAWAGLEIAAGPGDVGVRMELAASSTAGDLAGEQRLLLTTPSLGYRVRL
jgi:hypothetical protein